MMKWSYKYKKKAPSPTDINNDDNNSAAVITTLLEEDEKKKDLTVQEKKVTWDLRMKSLVDPLNLSPFISMLFFRFK